MANLSTLPKEILHEILSYFSPGNGHPAYTDLFSCSVVCKSVSEVANSALYSCIDLKREEDRYGSPSNETTRTRQGRLVQTLAENPSLGALVRVFKNYKNQSSIHSLDGTMIPETDVNVYTNMARNMRCLSKIFLMPTHVAAHIIANLQSYSQLSDLSIWGLSPEQHIWKNTPVALKRLTWVIPTPWMMGGATTQNTLENFDCLVNAVESTCPCLEYLDVSFCDVRSRAPTEISTASPELIQQYHQLDRTKAPKLTNLQHFGFQSHDDYKYQSQLSTSFVDFATRYGHTLKSVSLPVAYGPLTREKLDFILKVCEAIPGLTSLFIPDMRFDPGAGGVISSYAFFQELTAFLASPRFAIERFSILNIECSFSPSIGTLFQSWTSLKYLQIGDEDMNNGDYGDDGRPQFADYRPELLGFIQALPPSLEELYIELNGEGLWCDSEEDFDPMANMGTEIFTTLRCLRSCDIHAWISNMDGGLGWIPEKAVMHRRLPYATDSKSDPDMWKKVIWTSRLDCIYQGENESVKLFEDNLELDRNGEPFRGRDADEVWQNGYSFEVKRMPTGRGRPANRPDYSWPFYLHKLSSYEGFRDRHG